MLSNTKNQIKKGRSDKVSHELLKQILDELKGLNQRVGGIESEIQDVKSQMNSHFDTIETNMSHMQGDVSSIKNSVDRMEQNEPADVLAMLKQINGKLDGRDDEIQVLNKRLFKTESEVERLTRQ
jgi:predicted  nucleic acid-binding Zn-ribbon protein